MTIKQALDAHAEASGRVFAHDRTLTIGASEIGACARKTWFAKHAQKQDSGYRDRWGAKKRGDLIEAFWEKALRAHFGKGRLHYAGRYQKTLIDLESSLSATPDGLVELEDGECFAVECKSIDPRAKLEEARPEHVFQCQVQLGLLRKLTKYQPDYALLCYLDASFLDENREFVIKFDAEVFAQAQLRAATIMSANAADALRPEGVIAGGAECEYCPYRASCSAIRAGAVPAAENKLDRETLQEIAHLATESRRLKRQAEATELEARLLEDRIKEHLRRAGTRRAKGEGVSVTWSALKGRPSWNWPALRAAAQEVGLDLAPFEKTGDPSDRLDIRLDKPLEVL
jgi:hypothetical protein